MADIRVGLLRVFAVCLAIGAAGGALFGFALLVTAITGRDTPSSFLLGGFGFVLVVLSVLTLAFAVRQLRLTRPGMGA